MVKKIVYIFLFIVFVLVLIFGVFIYKNKPKYKGNLNIEGLTAKVEVYYDDFGIPHIFAENEHDAMVALGYVQTKDRWFQMEMLSRIVPGKLSEIFGEKLLETDKFFLSLGIHENNQKVLASLDKNSDYYKLSEAYLKGVNHFVDNGNTPIEFKILGIQRKHFTIEDIQNVFGYMSFGFAMAHKTDPLVSAIKEKLGDEYIQNLGLDIDPNSTLIKSYNVNDAITLSKSMNRIEKRKPIPSFIGSNSWVLGPQKTKNGKVIFENDPHIGYSQPGTWFQAHLKTPKHESYGFYLGLTPYPLLSHNRQLAYGLTMFENDDIDLYVEKINPQNDKEYLVDSSFHQLTKREYTINVKKGNPVTYITYDTYRGPIINQVVPTIKTEKPVSMYWVYLHRPNRLLELLYNISRAKNLDQFKENPPYLHAPGLNIMYGDVSGNVAWWASGHLYERAKNTSTKVLLDGSNTTNDSIVYKPFSENPQAINPAWHYVYSCNNQPVSLLSKRYIPGYYLPQDRANRVTQLLESKNDWTQSDVEAMALDNYSPIHVKLNSILVKNLKDIKFDPIENEAYNRIKNWNGKAETNNVGITIFNQFLYEYYRNMLLDELGDDIFKQFLNIHLSKRLLEPMMEGKYTIWSDDINTIDVKETNVEIQQKSFVNAVAKLKLELGNDVKKWYWGRVHKVEYKHPFGEISLLRPFFNVGPFPISGTNEVLNNQIFDLSESTNMFVNAGPSTRRIIDFSNVEDAKAIVPTGNSGHVLSRHYKDQSDLFLNGEFIPMLINEKIIKKSKNILMLNPNRNR